MHVSPSPCSSRLETHEDENLPEAAVPHGNCMFPFQIHVVHYNTKYDSFKEAMVHPDGLAVLGAFLEVSAIDQPCATRNRSRWRVGLVWAA